jgi:hypothetical protein
MSNALTQILVPCTILARLLGAKKLGPVTKQVPGTVFFVSWSLLECLTVLRKHTAVGNAEGAYAGLRIRNNFRYLRKTVPGTGSSAALRRRHFACGRLAFLLSC